VRGIVVPDREEDFAADPVELFFDLAFVFAFSQLVAHLVHHPDWAGVGEFALLFVMIWLPWTQFTWSANAVSGNTRSVRALFLIGTVASVPMGASVTTALGDGGPSFAIPLGVILSLGLFTMIAGFPRDHEVRASVVQYSYPNLIAIALMVLGAFLDRDARIVLWVAAMATVVAGTVMAGRRVWLVRPGHFAERHGLILIVALGEVIVALGIPVVDALESGRGLPAETLTALVAAGAFACLLWWAYFDRVNPALEHRHELHDEARRGRYARDVYTYAHMPTTAGVILTAAALEEIALHPLDELHPEFGWMLFGGMALFFGGVALSVWLAFRVVAKERLLGAIVLAAVVARPTWVDGLTLLIVIDVLLLGVLVTEHVRIEGPPKQRSRATAGVERSAAAE
jgi:low temperature requirement protein LtrA